MTYRVEVVKRLVYRVDADTPEEAQALGLLAAAGSDAPRLQQLVQADVVVLSRAVSTVSVSLGVDMATPDRVA